MKVGLHQDIRMAKYTCANVCRMLRKGVFVLINVCNAMLDAFAMCGHSGTHFAVVRVTTKLTNDLPNESKNWKTGQGHMLKLVHVGKLMPSTVCYIRYSAYGLVRVEEEQVAWPFLISS